MQGALDPRGVPPKGKLETSPLEAVQAYAARLPPCTGPMLLQSLSIADADKRADVNHRSAAERCRAGDESSESRALRRWTP